MRSVELKHAYRLINHGPTTLIGSQHGERKNVMAAAWVMAVDFTPPKLCAVIAGDTFTRKLIEASGVFTVNLPTVAQADLTLAVGSISGDEVDKLAKYGIATTPAETIAAPCIDGCVAWLECKVIPEPHLQKNYDLFMAEVVAARADERLFGEGEWRFDGHDQLRTLHHVARGSFFATGARLDAKKI
jgi:flavin reductase (DIM6/NTAB) family NADH-FMN oxidoreductase RutF